MAKGGDQFETFSSKSYKDVNNAFANFLKSKPRNVIHFRRFMIPGSKVDKTYIDSLPTGTVWARNTDAVHIIDLIYRDV